MMRAQPGDRLVLPACRAGEAPRVATVIEARHDHRRSAFIVRWERPADPTRAIALVFPCQETRVERAPSPSAGPRATGEGSPAGRPA